MSKLGSFFSKIKAFFEKLFESGNWERTVSSVITVIAPLVESIVALTAGEAASSEVQGVVNQVLSDLAAVQALATSATPATGATTYQQIGTVLSGIKTNLASLLAAGHIKDTATLTKVTAIVDTVVNECEAILSELPTAPAPAPPATPAPAAG